MRVLIIAALLLAACKPPYPLCKTDAHCAEHHQVCVQGECRQCNADAQCGEGQRCKGNLCGPLPQCQLDAECPADQRCRQERCGPECIADAECSPGFSCTKGRCEKPGELRTLEEGVEDATLTASHVVAGCQLPTVLFSFDDFSLSPEARNALDETVACLKKKGVTKLRLEGNTDERGTDEYNLALGLRRADAVKKYLVTLGFDGAGLRSITFGSVRPIDPHHTEEAWTKNRRVALTEWK